MNADVALLSLGEIILLYNDMWYAFFSECDKFYSIWKKWIFYLYNELLYACTFVKLLNSTPYLTKFFVFSPVCQFCCLLGWWQVISWCCCPWDSPQLDRKSGYKCKPWTLLVRKFTDSYHEFQKYLAEVPRKNSC